MITSSYDPGPGTGYARISRFHCVLKPPIPDAPHPRGTLWRTCCELHYNPTQHKRVFTAVKIRLFSLTTPRCISHLLFAFAIMMKKLGSSFVTSKKEKKIPHTSENGERRLSWSEWWQQLQQPLFKHRSHFVRAPQQEEGKHSYAHII